MSAAAPKLPSILTTAAEKLDLTKPNSKAGLAAQTHSSYQLQKVRSVGAFVTSLTPMITPPPIVDRVSPSQCAVIERWIIRGHSVPSRDCVVFELSAMLNRNLASAADVFYFTSKHAIWKQEASQILQLDSNGKASQDCEVARLFDCGPDTELERKNIVGREASEEHDAGEKAVTLPLTSPSNRLQPIIVKCHAPKSSIPVSRSTSSSERRSSMSDPTPSSDTTNTSSPPQISKLRNSKIAKRPHSVNGKPRLPRRSSNIENGGSEDVEDLSATVQRRPVRSCTSLALTQRDRSIRIDTGGRPQPYSALLTLIVEIPFSEKRGHILFELSALVPGTFETEVVIDLSNTEGNVNYFAEGLKFDHDSKILAGNLPGSTTAICVYEVDAELQNDTAQTSRYPLIITDEGLREGRPIAETEVLLDPALQDIVQDTPLLDANETIIDQDARLSLQTELTRSSIPELSSADEHTVGGCAEVSLARFPENNIAAVVAELPEEPSEKAQDNASLCTTRTLSSGCRFFDDPSSEPNAEYSSIRTSTPIETNNQSSWHDAAIQPHILAPPIADEVQGTRAIEPTKKITSTMYEHHVDDMAPCGAILANFGTGEEEPTDSSICAVKLSPVSSAIQMNSPQLPADEHVSNTGLLPNLDVESESSVGGSSPPLALEETRRGVSSRALRECQAVGEALKTTMNDCHISVANMEEWPAFASVVKIDYTPSGIVDDHPVLTAFFVITFQERYNPMIGDSSMVVNINGPPTITIAMARVNDENVSWDDLTTNVLDDHTSVHTIGLPHCGFNAGDAFCLVANCSLKHFAQAETLFLPHLTIVNKSPVREEVCLAKVRYPLHVKLNLDDLETWSHVNDHDESDRWKFVRDNATNRVAGPMKVQLAVLPKANGDCPARCGIVAMRLYISMSQERVALQSHIKLARSPKQSQADPLLRLPASEHFKHVEIDGFPTEVYLGLESEFVVMNNKAFSCLRNVDVSILHEVDLQHKILIPLPLDQPICKLHINVADDVGTVELDGKEMTSADLINVDPSAKIEVCFSPNSPTKQSARTNRRGSKGNVHRLLKSMLILFIMAIVLVALQLGETSARLDRTASKADSISHRTERLETRFGSIVDMYSNLIDKLDSIYSVKHAIIEQLKTINIDLSHETTTRQIDKSTTTTMREEVRKLNTTRQRFEIDPAEKAQFQNFFRGWLFK